jgi:hypothetical protein
MCVWLNPQKVAERGLRPQDAVAATRTIRRKVIPLPVEIDAIAASVAPSLNR